MKYFSIGMLLLSAIISYYFMGNGQPFFKDSYLTAKMQANEDEKSLLLLFVKDDCRVCEDQRDMMDSDDELVDFIVNRYETATVNIDDFDGKAIRDYYKVQSVPSLVLVNQSGDVQWSHNGSISKNSLLHRLDNRTTTQTDVASAATTSRPSPSVETRRPHTDNSKAATANKTTSEVNLNTRPAQPLISYQIQYGFFGSKENADTMVQKLSKAGQPECYLQNEHRDGKTFYRVLSPMYAQLEMANVILRKMKTKGIDGQVKTIE